MSDRYLVRDATEADLPRIALLEIEVAKISFGDEAVVDPKTHTDRVRRSLGGAGEVTVVVVAADDPGTALGWGWLSNRANSLTGARYGNFRTLATFPHADRTEIGEILLRIILQRATGAGVTELVGKVHVENGPMRVLYRKFGFEAVHLTMRKRFP
ncbi:GNAT family N-acetyltransferase [Actinokineospora enzanensis]|uniref:GNAT family N-acetyltransferase n=1 Tax=Actinokineospora enzanensis TaxID=155975 RepID=UPI000374F695|nr:GNAT family N-acetyltransferase [Actinokineospora enzanensis]